MQKFSKLSIGIPFIDQKWGGVYPGGNYFIIGSKFSGKTFLSLKIVENFVNSGYKTILLSNQREKNLEIQAASLFFNIEDAIKDGKLVIRKFGENLNSIEKIKNLVDEFNPVIFIFDKILDNSLIKSSENYLEILGIFEEKNITLFSTSDLPKSESSKQLLRKVLQYSTGIIQLQKSSEKRNYSGQIIIKPNVGHIEGEFETNYKIDARKGFITLADNENSIFNMLSKANSEYDSFSQPKDFEYSNIYDFDEFSLFIENKKSYVEETNADINLLVFEIQNGFAETIELCKTLQKYLTIGDKISYKNKKVFVLPRHNSYNETDNLLTKLNSIISSSFKNYESNIIVTNQKLTKEYSL